MTEEWRVYVMACEASSKIGIAKDAYARLSAIQTANASKVELFYSSLVSSRENIRDVERLAHETLAPVRQRGEWFAVPAAIAAEIVDEIVMSEATAGRETKRQRAQRHAALKEGLRRWALERARGRLQ